MAMNDMRFCALRKRTTGWLHGLTWAGPGHTRARLGLVAGRTRAEKDLGSAVGLGWLRPGFLSPFFLSENFSFSGFAKAFKTYKPKYLKQLCNIFLKSHLTQVHVNNTQEFENKIVDQILDKYWGLNQPQNFVYKNSSLKTLKFNSNQTRHKGLFGTFM